jgi:hypothetical protein
LGLSVQGQILKAQLQIALAKDAGERLALDLAEVIHTLPPQQQEQARRILIHAASAEVTHG